ncbi:hypothetical protein l11_08370 [Neisseria weaveri LMG 5135]|nr:hypothetical protein l11_08370 [Neisseria weaveri LMG 5135]
MKPMTPYVCGGVPLCGKSLSVVNGIILAETERPSENYCGFQTALDFK